MSDVIAANNKTKVTPADNTALANHKGVLVINAGDLAVRYNEGDSPVVLTLPAMSWIPFQVYSIDSTDTTATEIFIVN